MQNCLSKVARDYAGDLRIKIKKLRGNTTEPFEPTMGFEPTTYNLRNCCSTS